VEERRSTNLKGGNQGEVDHSGKMGGLERELLISIPGGEEREPLMRGTRREKEKPKIPSFPSSRGRETRIGL